MLRRKREFSVFAVTFNKCTTEEMLSIRFIRRIRHCVAEIIKTKNGLIFSHSSANARKLRALQHVNHLNSIALKPSFVIGALWENVCRLAFEDAAGVEEPQRGLLTVKNRSRTTPPSEHMLSHVNSR